MAEKIVDQLPGLRVPLPVRGQMPADEAGTGVPYRNVYAFKFTFRDGQIARVAEYANPVTYAKLAGVPVG